MVTIRAIIVDDEMGGREVLSNILKQYFPDVNVVGMASSKDEAKKLFSAVQPNLIFLDIEMPHGSGFDLLKEIPTKDFEIIFVTGFDHYALKAIKFHALDYLLKPINVEELKLAIERVKKTFQKTIDSERLEQLLLNLGNPNKGAHKMAIPTITGKEFVPIQDIVRLEADGGCTWFYLQSGRKFISSKNLGEYEQLLPNADSIGEHHFARVHHAHLINLFYILKINNREHYVQMHGQEKVHIAQRRKAKFLATLKKLKLV